MSSASSMHLAPSPPRTQGASASAFPCVTLAPPPSTLRTLGPSASAFPRVTSAHPVSPLRTLGPSAFRASSWAGQSHWAPAFAGATSSVNRASVSGCAFTRARTHAEASA